MSKAKSPSPTAHRWYKRWAHIGRFLGRFHRQRTPKSYCPRHARKHIAHSVEHSSIGTANISIGTPPLWSSFIECSARLMYQSFPFRLPPNRRKDRIQTKLHVVTALANTIIVFVSAKPFRKNYYSTTITFIVFKWSMLVMDRKMKDKFYHWGSTNRFSQHGTLWRRNAEDAKSGFLEVAWQYTGVCCQVESDVGQGNAIWLASLRCAAACRARVKTKSNKQSYAEL